MRRPCQPALGRATPPSLSRRGAALADGVGGDLAAADHPLLVITDLGSRQPAANYPLLNPVLTPLPPPVEEYVNKGGVMDEAIAHPDKYGERFVALNVARPLLAALAYLHASGIIHR